MTRVKVPTIIREIFPLTIANVSRIILFLIAFIALCTLYGCGSCRMATQILEHVSKDTVYLNSKQYDSIYIYQERYQDRSRDTIYLKDISVEYRYRLLRDTIKVVQKDSIPYEVTIAEVKEISRPLTLYDKLCRSSFWFVLGFILYWFYHKVKSINYKR